MLADFAAGLAAYSFSTLALLGAIFVTLREPARFGRYIHLAELVLFDSRLVEHEVLPSEGQRFALTMWFTSSPPPADLDPAHRAMLEWAKDTVAAAEAAAAAAASPATAANGAPAAPPTPTPQAVAALQGLRELQGLQGLQGQALQAREAEP